MSYSKTLWVNTDERKLVKSFLTNSEANKPQFTQGDTVPVKVILLESTGNQGVPFRNIKINSETLKLALGRVDQAPTSGTFTLTFGADTTAALAYNVSAADLSTALNGLTSISNAGGVTVSGNDGGPFTIAFDAVGAQSYITGDLALLEPASVLNNTRKQTGDGSTKEIQVIRLAEGVLALQTSFSAIAAPVATISTLTAGGSGANEIQQLVIDQECIGGLIALTFSAESTSFNYGATADEVKESLEGNSNIGAGNIAVTKVSDIIYTFEFIGTLADANQAEFSVDDSGLEGFSGFSGDLDLDSYSVESFLAGAASADCYIEIELTDGSNKTTLCTSSAKIVNDIINSATAAPPLSPSVTFVESVNDQTGVAVLDPDDLDDTSTTNKFATAAQLAKVDYLSVTQAVDLDAIGTKIDGIETGADVTDAANVDAAGAVMNTDTSTASMSFVIDEDDMSSDSATKVPTQQSVKKYVDDNAGTAGGFGANYETVSTASTLVAGDYGSSADKTLKWTGSSGGLTHCDSTSLSAGDYVFILNATTSPLKVDFTNASDAVIANGLEEDYIDSGDVKRYEYLGSNEWRIG